MDGAVETQADVATTARAALVAGDATTATTAYRRLVRAEPGAGIWRLRLADALEAAGEPQEARERRAELAVAALDGGAPLVGLTAGLLIGLGDLAKRMGPYLAGSEQVGHPAPPAPPGPPAEVGVPEDDPDAPLPAFPGRPGPKRPVPLLSELDQGTLASVVAGLSRHPLQPGQALLTEGESAGAVYFLVAGSLKVTKGDEFRGDVELGRITAGSVVGEMALILNRRRTATVTATEDAEVLRLDLSVLQALARSNPAIQAALVRYTQQRLLAMLLDTSPLFRGLSPAARGGLLARFQPERIPEGETVIAEGDESPSLGLVMDGEVDVLRFDGTRPAKLATLGAGQVFGEMSFVTGAPASASVIAATDAVLMTLDRDALGEVCRAHPEVEERLRALSDDRLLDNRFIFEDDEFFEDAD